MRRRRQVHICQARGCRAEVGRWKRFCGVHWKLLPFAQRKAIAEAIEARALHVVARLAGDGAAWLEEHGPAAEAARRIGERVDG